MHKRIQSIYLLLIILLPIGLIAQWSTMNTGINPNHSLRSISFPTNEIGYITSAKSPEEDISSLYKTIDGGLNWQLVDSNIESTYEYKGNITFVDKKTGFLSGGKFFTKDGGVTWTPTINTEYNSIFFTENSDIFCLDPSESSPTEGILLKSTDFGTTWKTLAQINGSLSHFEIIDENTFYGFSIRDIQISKDRGNKWDILAMNSLSEGFPVSISDFKTAQNGIVVFTYHGSSQTTLDGGMSWIQNNFPGLIRAIDHDSSGFYAVGQQNDFDSGGIFYSPNGTSWINCNAESKEQINDLVLLKDNSAWAVGDFGTVIQTKNLLSVTTQELTNKDKIKIFPNPTVESLNIEINTSEEIKKIQLITAEGKVINDCLPSITKLDVSTLKRGIYFLLIELKNGEQTIQKLVVN